MIWCLINAEFFAQVFTVFEPSSQDIKNIKISPESYHVSCIRVKTKLSHVTVFDESKMVKLTHLQE